MKKKIKQIHGELEKNVPTTLDQIWGYSGQSRYGTMNEEEYVKEIKSFNKTDLQAHAVKHGILPNSDRQRLENTLIKEFKKYVGTFKKPVTPKDKNSKLPNQTVLDILSEGR
jgi:hypothetical protein